MSQGGGCTNTLDARGCTTSIQGSDRFSDKDDVARSVALATVVLYVAVTACSSVRPARPAVVTHISEISRDTEQTPAARAVVSGTITYHDSNNHVMFFQDATGGAQVELAPNQEGNFVSRRASLDGLGVRRELAPVLVYAKVTDRGDGDLPQPIDVTAGDFGNARVEARRATLEGIVESAYINSQGVLVLGLISARQPIENYVRDYSSAHYAIIGARVRTVGVVKTELDIDGVAARRQLYTQRFDQVRVVEPAVPAAQLPVMTVAEAARAGRQPVRVRFQAKLAPSEDASGMVATDATGHIAVLPAPGTAPALGPSLDVTGFAVRTEKGQVVVRNASVIQPVRSEGAAPGRMLRHVAEIRSLSPEAANGGIPVQVTGTVTYNHRLDYTLFVQDETGGIYVSCKGGEASPVLAGDVVEVRGRTAGGDFAPIISGATLHPIGRGPLPEPARVPLESILEGIEDSQWVEAEGIVHRIVRDLDPPDAASHDRGNASVRPARRGAAADRVRIPGRSRPDSRGGRGNFRCQAATARHPDPCAGARSRADPRRLIGAGPGRSNQRTAAVLGETAAEVAAHEFREPWSGAFLRGWCTFATERAPRRYARRTKPESTRATWWK